ncbi:ABC transporter permease [Filimonas effusa]|uniref:ABC transporter permease n=1 Tax=Filimonas effusa TaxID=2508721 RepID=A0A4Q1DBQ3_9BACT|nr:ABC transporter permease [Filimonas effusa]RXK86023.1 ABC transporter permease [Filimonas effusa]
MIPRLIIRNLLYTPLSTLLSFVLLLFGVGIISVLLNLNEQLEQKFSGSLANIDMVIGAKGSPLQLVLSAVYHADAPTGNIKAAEVEKVLNNPMIEKAVPLAYGDTYQGFSITGSDSGYISLYNGRLKKGRLFRRKLEAVLGSNVAAVSGLDVDSTFAGTHGQGGHVHEDQLYTVTGILQPTGTVLDNVVITDLATVRAIHEHAHEHHRDHHEEQEEEITAVLLKFRSPMGIMVLPRLINETTQMQAVSPSLEINRLMNLVGVGVVVLQYVAAAIIAMAALSVFVALLNRLKDRRYEIAIMRSLGYSRWQLFSMLLAEGWLLALAGFAGGLLLSRLGLLLLDAYTAGEYHFNWQLFRFSTGEASLLLAVSLVGIIASLIPAITAFRMDLSKTLSHES